MKSQIKRFSKSTLSVVLAFCMLVSCMTVGLIATDAAQTAEERVGGNTDYYLCGDNMGGGWDTSGIRFDSNGEAVFTLTTQNSNFKLYHAGWGDDCYFGNGESVTALDTNYSLSQNRGGSNCKMNIAAGTYKIKLVSGQDGSSITFKVLDYSPKTVYFKKGTLNWSNVYVALFNANVWENDGVTTSNSSKVDYHKMTLVSGSNDVYEYTTTADFSYVVFIKDNQDNYGHLWSTEAAYSGGYDEDTPLYIPQTTSYDTVNNTNYYDTNGNHSFTTNGTWSAYSALDPACSSVSLEKTSPASGTIYAGVTSVTYTATASDAVSGVKYNFKVDGTTVQNNTSNTYTTTFDSAGTKSVTVSVEKDGYSSVTSSAVSTTVDALPDVYFNYNVTETDNPKMTYDATASAAKSNHIVYKLERNWKGNSTYNIMVYDGSDRFKTSGAADITDSKPLSGSGVSTDTTDYGWMILKTNTGIASSETGKYTFYWDFTDKKLYVEYPYKVTFNNNGHGSAPAAQIVNYNAKATKPSTLTATGWTHDGNWYTEPACSNQYNFNTAVTANKTLYAKWTQNEYTISYPSTTTGYTLGGNKPTTAHYNDTISFTVTPLANYRIGSVKYKPTGGSETDCTVWDDNEYRFTMPDKNVTVIINMVETRTVTLTASTGFGTKQYKIGNGSYEDYSAPFTVDKGSVVTFKVTYSNGYVFDNVTNATASSSNTIFTTAAINSDTIVTINAKKQTYDLIGAVSPNQGGSVTFYSTYDNAVAGTSAITTAQIDNNVFAKYSPDSDRYRLSSFSKSGDGLSNLTVQSDTNIVKFKMGYSNATITANVVATTPTFTGTWSGMTVYANENFTYSNTGGGVSPTGCTYTYSFNGITDQASSAFTAPDRPGTYTLTIKASNKPAGISNAATATTSVSIKVIYREKTVTYYIDMHSNTVDNDHKVNISIVDSSGNVLKDSELRNCSADLVRVGSTDSNVVGTPSVYTAQIKTPISRTGTMYSNVYIKISYKGESHPVTLNGNEVRTMLNNQSYEVWLEAINERSQTLVRKTETRNEPDIFNSGSMEDYIISVNGITASVNGFTYKAYTNSKRTDYKIKLPLVKGDNTITVPGGSTITKNADFTCDYVLTFSYENSTFIQKSLLPVVRRIYLEKPTSITTGWMNLYLYHWGSYTDIGFNDNSIPMKYLGYDASNYYYYVDIPKTITESKTENGIQVDTEYAVNNILFKGTGDNQTKQTSNIEGISSSNYFKIYKSGNSYIGEALDSNAVIPNYSKYVSQVKLNYNEDAKVNIRPEFAGKKIEYVSSDDAKVTVNENDELVIAENASTWEIINGELRDNPVVVTVKVFGTVGAKLTNTENAEADDWLEYTISVSISNPGKFNGYYPMSLESAEYTVNVPTVNNSQTGTEDQPGYFDMAGVTITVSGIQGVESSTNSAIITKSQTATVDGVAYLKSFTVKYAKKSGFEGYSEIQLTGDITTKSIHYEGSDRYGLDHWEKSAGSTKADPNPEYTQLKTIVNGVETVLTKNVIFGTVGNDNTFYNKFDAVFRKYSYVDVTFVYDYYEYKPKVVDGMIEYPYDTNWVGSTEDRFNAGFNADAHLLKTITVNSYEVRDVVKGDYYSKTSEQIGQTKLTKLVTAATLAIGRMPYNNYYSYTINGDDNIIPKTSDDENDGIKDVSGNDYAITVHIHMSHNPQQYNVYLNGELNERTSQDDNRKYYYYQEYADVKADSTSNWYAVDGLTADASNAPLLSSGTTNYKFRVKGTNENNNTYLRALPTSGPNADTTTITDENFNRSEVDFSHYEVDHKQSNNNVIEYLLQNFYIADFFSPEKVLDYSRPKTSGEGYLPYDDAQFVGGGVVYYSMNGATENNQGTPFANAVSSGYVGNDGKINANAIKEMLKSNIEAQYAKDNIAGTVGEEDAMKAAYGTEIAATKNVEGGFNTGIIYRYLPLNQYTRYGSGEKTVDITVSNGSNITNYTLTTKDQTTQKWGCSNSQTSTADPEIANGKRTIRFTNNQNWDAVFVHFWGGSSASNWPGIRMTDKDNNVFEAVIPADATQIVFNDGCSMPATDENGSYTLDYSVNKNTFRYSNSLQSYQYVYASGNENKTTNAGKNMRLYSYYVYSYVTYDQETNVPVTKYEIVLSDNYSDASTYWEGNPNPDPSN